MNLKEWTKEFIRFKDCMKRQIITLEETEKGFLVEEKKEVKHYLVQEDLTLPEERSEKTFIMTMHTKENVQVLKDQWEVFAKEKTLTIYFVNIKTNEKWHIQPYIHAKITEDIEKSIDILSEQIQVYL